jgi:GNAT superfamily N-acetyltransferase
MELRQVRLTDPLVAPVIRGLTREYDVRYGEIDEMATVDAEEVDPPAGTFVVLIDGGEILAGGGLRRVADDTCEVKRMWAAAGHRRRGYASQVHTGLADAARTGGGAAASCRRAAVRCQATKMHAVHVNEPAFERSPRRFARRERQVLGVVMPPPGTAWQRSRRARRSPKS